MGQELPPEGLQCAFQTQFRATWTGTSCPSPCKVQLIYTVTPNSMNQSINFYLQIPPEGSRSALHINWSLQSGRGILIISTFAPILRQQQLCFLGADALCARCRAKSKRWGTLWPRRGCGILMKAAAAHHLLGFLIKETPRFSLQINYRALMCENQTLVWVLVSRW